MLILKYIIVIILSIIFSVVLPILLRKTDHKKIKTILIVLWSIAVLLDLLKYGYGFIYNMTNGIKGIQNYDIPLWTCSMFLYILPIALFSKNEKISRVCAAFVCTISFFAGMINFAVPCDESFFSFYGMHKTIYHYILMLTPAIMLGTGYIKLKFKDVIGIMAVLIIFGIPVYIFNFIFKQDYMFTYDGSWLPIDVSSISSNKPLYTLLCLVFYAFIAVLVVGIDNGVRKLSKKKR